MKQKLIIPINCRETFEDLIEQNIDLFAEKDNDLGQTNTVKMSIDTGNHPPIKLRPKHNSFCQMSNCRQDTEQFVGSKYYMSIQITLELPYIGC